MTDEELPNQLNRLEIGPMLPQIKLNDQNELPVSLNPFYDENIKDSMDTSSRTKLLFGSTTSSAAEAPFCRRRNCSCRMRRRSESILDDCKTPTPSTSNQPSLSIRAHQHERTIKNGLLLKKTACNITGGSSSAGPKKLVLREPVLHALQKCFHPHTRVRKRLQLAAGEGGIDTREQNSPCATIEALNLDDSIGLLKLSESKSSSIALSSGSKLSYNRKLTYNERRESMSDFPDLVSEFQTLLANNVTFNTNLSFSSSRRRNAKNFNTIQSPDLPKLEEICENDGSYGNARTKQSLNGKQISAREDQSTRSIGCSRGGSTSCSLQARINAATATANSGIAATQSTQTPTTSSDCDITIDELASYFETFVHIPKKMSTMAEMMYI